LEKSGRGFSFLPKRSPKIPTLPPLGARADY
jgi:hypothetical protein